MRTKAFSGFAVVSFAVCCAVLGCAAAEAPELAGDDDDDGQGGSGNSAGEPSTGGSGDTGGSGGSTPGTGGTTSTGGVPTGGTTSTGGAPTGGTAGTTPTGGAAGTTTRPPGRPTIALPYMDDFETSEAKDWRFTSLPWTVADDAGNHVLQFSGSSSSSEDTWAVGGDRNWTDVRVSMRVKFVSGDPMILLSPRWKDLDNYAFVEYEMEDKPKLRRRLAGNTADIITTEETMTFAVGQWHTVVVTLAGTMATLEIDDAVLGMGTDSSPVPSGGIAIAVENGVIAIDDVSVTAP